MRLPALEIRQLDVGRSLGAAEQIKSMRTQNALAQAKAQKAKAVADITKNIWKKQGGTAPGAAPADNLGLPGLAPANPAGNPAAPRNSLAGPAAPGAAPASVAPSGVPSVDISANQAPTASNAAQTGGDTAGLNTDLLQQLAAIDSDAAKGILDFATTANEAQIKQARQQAEQMAKVAFYLEGLPEDQREAEYQQIIQAMIQSGSQFGTPPPANYDPARMRLVGLQALATDDFLAKIERDRNADMPRSGVGDLAFDLKKGNITPEQYAEGIKAKNKPLVQNITHGEKKGTEALIRIGESEIKEYNKQALQDRQLIPRLNQISQALMSGQVETGKLQEFTLPLKQWADSFGWVNPGNLSEQEAVQAAMKFMIPRMRPVGSGATSNFEMENFTKAAPNFGNTTGGNIIISRSFLQIARRNQKASDIAKKYFADKLEKGQIPSTVGLGEHIDEKLGKIFPEPKTEAEYGKIEDGTVYVDTNGKFKVKMPKRKQ